MYEKRQSLDSRFRDISSHLSELSALHLQRRMSSGSSTKAELHKNTDMQVDRSDIIGYFCRGIIANVWGIFCVSLSFLLRSSIVVAVLVVVIVIITIIVIVILDNSN